MYIENNANKNILSSGLKGVVVNNLMLILFESIHLK